MEQKRSFETLEQVGGSLCLDFINTINSRLEPEHDYLGAYPDLVDWAQKVKVLSPQQAKSLKQRAAQDPKKAGEDFERARSARETLYRVFSAIAEQSAPRQEDLDAITALLKEATLKGQLLKAGDRYKLDWKADKNYEAVLWLIIASAEDLLFSEEMKRVKECPGCGWLFLDMSRNRSRMWCSMDTCGARDKMQRYYKRRKVR